MAKKAPTPKAKPDPREAALTGEAERRKRAEAIADARRDPSREGELPEPQDLEEAVQVVLLLIPGLARKHALRKVRFAWPELWKAASAAGRKRSKRVGG